MQEIYCPVCGEKIQFKESDAQSSTFVTCHNCQNTFEVPNNKELAQVSSNENINWRKLECPNCKGKMRIEEIDESDLNSVIMNCRNCKKTFKFTYDEPIHPKSINKFNWGAFILWNWWGLGNGMPHLFFIFIVLYIIEIFLELIGGAYEFIGFLAICAVILCMGIYCGNAGNMQSWKKKNWKSIESFENNQGNWTAVGVVSTIIIVIYIIYQSYQIAKLL